MALTAAEVSAAKPRDKEYKLSAGGGLYLLVRPNGSKYWRLKYRYGGKERKLALGVFPQVSLKEAKARRDQQKAVLEAGKDPSAKKKADKRALKHAVANSFKVVAGQWFADNEHEWSEAYKIRLWRMIERDLISVLGNDSISNLSTGDIKEALSAVQSRGAIETAHRAKRVATEIFKYAIGRDLAEQNPVEAVALNKRPKTRHFPAIIDPDQFGKLLLAIDQFDGTLVVAAALKLAPHLFVRPGELRKMEWQEINTVEKMWLIPGVKMKQGADHLVPLSSQSMALIESIRDITGRGSFVFPSARGASRPMSDAACRVALRSLGYTNEQHSIHGFRASARTLIHERLNYKPEVIERQLSHGSSEALRGAYDRTLFLDERVKMMQAWSDYMDQLKAAAGSPRVVTAAFRKKV